MNDFTTRSEVDVLETLANRSPCHVMDIANTLESHPITIDRTCARLHEKEYISSLGRGLYEITEEGKHQLETQCNS